MKTTKGNIEFYVTEGTEMEVLEKIYRLIHKYDKENHYVVSLGAGGWWMWEKLHLPVSGRDPEGRTLKPFMDSVKEYFIKRSNRM